MMTIIRLDDNRVLVGQAVKGKQEELTDDKLSQYVNFIAMEALVEQYTEADKKRKRLNHQLDSIRFRMTSDPSLRTEWMELSTRRDSLTGKLATLRHRINKLAKGMPLPFHCFAGTVRKGYSSDRYYTPHRYKLSGRKQYIGPKKRFVVKECA